MRISESASPRSFAIAERVLVAFCSFFGDVSRLRNFHPSNWHVFPLSAAVFVVDSEDNAIARRLRPPDGDIWTAAFFGAG